jgi:acetyl-CoA carboxylase carboxyltransferase component
MSVSTMSNREAMLAKLAELEAQHAKAIAGGGEKYVERHRKRGKLLPRERIELMLDPDSPFLELSPLAAWGTDYQVGASVVTGIGVVEGVECMISASDPTVKGGASNPWTAKKGYRAADIAAQNRLPTIHLVESGGADLPTQKEIFIPGGRIFRDLTKASAAKIPTVALVFGNSTAGGAYLPGMSDYVVMVKERAKVWPTISRSMSWTPSASADGSSRGSTGARPARRRHQATPNHCSTWRICLTSCRPT